MHDGFVGCVSRVEFDDMYPLKLLFQENPPANVKSLGPCKNQFVNTLIHFNLIILLFFSCTD